MAKRTPKARKATEKAEPKAEPICLGFLPVDSRTFTPERAERWLEDDAPVWHELIDVVMARADADERRALGELAYALGQATLAASVAVRTGKRAPVDSVLDAKDGSVGDDIERLALVLRAASKVDDGEDSDCLPFVLPALHACAAGAVHLARLVKGEERKRWDAEIAKRNAERMKDPRWQAYAEKWQRFNEAGDEAAAAGHAAQGGA